jgi:hypothetical protein
LGDLVQESNSKSFNIFIDSKYLLGQGPRFYTFIPYYTPAKSVFIKNKFE